MTEFSTVNLEQWVRDWAGKEYSSIEIDWSLVNIIPGTPVYSGRLHAGHQGRSEAVAEYENWTENQQTYQLSVKRRLHSECSFVMQMGFSRGPDFDVIMETPPDLAQFGLTSSVVLKPNQPPSFDETKTVELNTPVQVSPECGARVSIGSKDKVYSGSFTQDIRVRGRVSANLYKGAVFSGSKHINVRELGLKYRGNDSDDVTIAGSGSDGITVHVTGTCKFRFVSCQKITVNEWSMSPSDDYE